MNDQSSGPVIRVCVLAAGMSARFGTNKLTQTLHAKPLLQHSLIAANSAFGGRVNLVVGHDEQIVRSVAAGLADRIIVNENYRSGIGTSISTGVHALRENADAILIMLADQALVTATHIGNIIKAWSGADNEIVASSYDATTGPPILFPSKAFDLLCNLTGDTGARAVLADENFAVRLIDCPPAGFDVDTPEDLKTLDDD